MFRQGKTQAYRNKRKRIILAADSHGKNLGLMLQQKMGKDYDLTVLSFPGGTLSYVAEKLDWATKDFTKEDRAIILAGTNDIKECRKNIPRKNISDYSSVIDSLSKAWESLKGIALRTNLVVINIPDRYDKPKLNMKINHANLNLEYFTKEIIAMNFLKMKFKRTYYTQDGLHLNWSGKIELIHHLADFIKEKDKKKNQPYKATMKCNKAQERKLMPLRSSVKKARHLNRALHVIQPVALPVNPIPGFPIPTIGY